MEEKYKKLREKLPKCHIIESPFSKKQGNACNCKN